MKTYDLEWQHDPRLLTDHLGKGKYSTSGRAVGELVANAFDAGALRVNIDLTTDALGTPVELTIRDNGRGISPERLRARFMVVAVAPEPGVRSQTQLGRLGVGRFAVARIGATSYWESVSRSADGTSATRIKFTIDADAPRALRVEESKASPKSRTGTFVRVVNLYDSGATILSAPRLGQDLLSQFCSYLLGNRQRKIVLNDEVLDVDGWIDSREEEVIEGGSGHPGATLHHLLLQRPLESGRLDGQLLFAAKGRTITSCKLEDPPSPTYLALVECPYLDTIVTANREALIELDQAFSSLKCAVEERVDEFTNRYRRNHTQRFIEAAREKEFYPFRNEPQDAVAIAQQAMYDVVLNKVNEHANLGSMTQRQQALVYKLLRRAMENENLEVVLGEVASLSDEDIHQFRKVLERTTLNAIVRLSSEVTSRIEFLDVLHELVYGEPAKSLKERSQLHKILEPHCWIFGPEFHLATSDESFRKVIRRHRELAGLGPAVDEPLRDFAGIDDIPDLFLAAQKDYPTSPKHRHVLVELKAPSVALGRKEVDQIRRYADTILDSSQFDTQSTTWDIFLVSSRATGMIDRQRRQEGRLFGEIERHPNMRLWAFEWSEIIAKARDELQLVRNHLHKKSRELSVSDYLRENFPDVLVGLEARQRGAA